MACWGPRVDTAPIAYLEFIHGKINQYPSWPIRLWMDLAGLEMPLALRLRGVNVRPG